MTVTNITIKYPMAKHKVIKQAANPLTLQKPQSFPANKFPKKFKNTKIKLIKSNGPQKS